MNTEMEFGDLSHMGVEELVIMLMLYSASPHGRRLAEELLTGDPFNIDIKLDMGAKNRGVEILNARLKTMGLRLVFEKRLKQSVRPILTRPIEYLYSEHSRRVRPVYYTSPEELYDPEYLIKRKEMENGLIRPVYATPIEFLFGKDYKGENKK